MIARPPVLVGFLLRHCALGSAAGALLLAALVGFDVGGFGQLIWHSEQPWLVLAVLQLAFTITFGSAAMGSAIFLLPSAAPDDGAPGAVADHPPQHPRGLLPARLRVTRLAAPRPGRSAGTPPKLPFWLVPGRG